MNIVITYRHQGNEDYGPLMKTVRQSIKKMGYNHILVHAEAFYNPLMIWILEAQKNYIESDAFNCNSVLFSPDALIIKPLEEIFEQDFDCAVTLRADTILNNGVIFIKPQNKNRLIKLWDDAIKKCWSYHAALQNWGGDQKALQDVLSSADYKPHGLNVIKVDMEKYNAPYIRAGIETNKELLEKASIVHFKGDRKKLMQETWEYICSK